MTSRSSGLGQNPPVIQPVTSRPALGAGLSLLISTIIGVVSSFFIPWQGALAAGGVTFLLTRLISWCRNGESFQSGQIPLDQTTQPTNVVLVQQPQPRQGAVLHIPPFHVPAPQPSQTLLYVPHQRRVRFAPSHNSHVQVGGGHRFVVSQDSRPSYNSQVSGHIDRQAPHYFGPSYNTHVQVGAGHQLPISRPASSGLGDHVIVGERR